ncbi:hypothetical protein ACKWTF_014395 [Chironomus riparius]
MKSTIFFCATISDLILTKSTSSQNISVVGISICQIIEEFYTKYSKNIEIIDFGGFQGQLIEKIMENLNNSITVTSHKVDEPSMWIHKLSMQSILLFYDFQDLFDFNLKDLVQMQFNNPIRFTIYCQNASEFYYSRLKTDFVIM